MGLDIGIASFVSGDGKTVGVTVAVWDAVGDLVGVVIEVGDEENTIHGGRSLSQLLWEPRVFGMQQSLTPPGRSSHMAPPHIPHKLAQETVPTGRVFLIPVTQLGSAVSGDGNDVLDGCGE